MADAASWYSLAELAAMALPGLPPSRRRLDERAEAEGWAQRIGADGKALARQREGRGGGIEYHADVLPAAARIELIRRAAGAANDGALPAIRPLCEDGTHGWRWFERQSDKVREEALKRAETLTSVETFENAGLRARPRSRSITIRWPMIASQTRMSSF